MTFKPHRVGKYAATAVVLALVTGARPSAGPRPGDPDDWDSQVRHVLLVSIDGMHALDYENCVSTGTCPHLAALGKTGVTYTRTTTARPSDSFPGLMALVTGGTPKTVGAFYDVAYDRVLAGPTIDTGNGLPGTGPSGCSVGHVAGYQTEYEEGVELNQHNVNGGGPYSMFDGGVRSIDPLKLPRDPFNDCKPVYPWNFIRTNTIYGVIHAAGLYTAWSDKHPVYATVSGPTGTSVPSNIDDYYAPEVNSDIVSIPGFKTISGDDCTNIPHAAGDDWTTDFAAIRCYDQLKVNAVVNEIMGKDHLGTKKAPVPAILGMNFQAVSVGQKLIKGAVKGGYTNAAGTPTTAMQSEITFVDAAIGQMVDALQDQDLLRSTAVIITAKHGQSPIDPNRFFPIPGHSGTNGQPPSAVIGAFLPLVYANPNNGLGLAEDDISQIWLTSPADTATAVDLLETTGKVPGSDATAIGLGQIFFGPSITTMFNAPGVPKDLDPCCSVPKPGDLDPRTPDIIVIPNVGVVYTGSLKKQSEHGGFAHDDTNVMLLVSNPSIKGRTDTSFVETDQVAPTILRLLGLDPDALDAVRLEGTPVLPGLRFDHR
jgi:Type I phosphodiesterase / nucleotide pyrophosphatase